MNKNKMIRGRDYCARIHAWFRHCSALFLFVFLGFSGVQANDTISVVTENWRPYSYAGENGEILGDATELVLKVMERAGLDYSIRIYPWSRAYAKAVHEKNTLIYAMLHSPERAEIFQMIGQVAPSDRLYFYRLKGRTDVDLKTPGETRRYVIGASRDSVMEAYLKERSFPKTRIVVSTANAFAMLERGHVDLVLSSAVNARSLLVKDGKPLDTYMPVLLAQECRPFMAMGPKADPAIVARIKAAYESLLSDKTIPDFAAQ